MKDFHKKILIKIRHRIPHISLPKTITADNPVSYHDFIIKKLIKGDKLKNTRSKVLLNRSITVLVSLFITLVLLSIYNVTLKKQIANSEVLRIPNSEFITYPYIRPGFMPNITSESAIIYDDTAKVTLFVKKPMLRFSMASTTKIMTALVALEHYGYNDPLTVRNIYTEGAIIGFQKGEQVSFEHMLYALLLPSANDAAFAIAENYPGGLAEFIRQMNRKAEKLHLIYTHYADPAGLDDDGNYTTITDLAKLASTALKNKKIAEVISTRRKVISTVDGSQTYTINNLNKLLGEYGIIGVKTGFTQGAGEVLVTAKIDKGHLFIIIVMKSLDRFADTAALLKYISDSVSYIKPHEYLLNSP